MNPKTIGITRKALIIKTKKAGINNRNKISK